MDLIKKIKKLPATCGVYLFKNDQEQVLYIGKAKNLKKRGASYIQQQGSDFKVDSIFSQSCDVDHIITKTELEALLLEAKLIGSYQPKYNVLLKSGQPFVFLFISNSRLPELKIVRNQKKKGSYFGPFLEKGVARKAYDFLIKTFRLKLCKKKIEGGCLHYHMGLCSGVCRSDFDKEGYLKRLELAKKLLKRGTKSFLTFLEEQIVHYNELCNFEHSRQLHQYYQVLEKIGDVWGYGAAQIEEWARKDIWIVDSEHRVLVVFSEQASSLKKRRSLVLSLAEEIIKPETIEEYFLSFYRTFRPPATILTNFDLGGDTVSVASFLKKWHDTEYDVTIQKPASGHFASLVRLAKIHVQEEQKRQASLSSLLKNLLKLPIQPHTIDCFDISHKQGMFMVGSCVRFKDGKVDKDNLRRFHIKTVDHQDDYAALREIVSRRYRDKNDFPDLVLIDGGKGQLNAVADILPDVELISLAKREETIFSKRFEKGKKLNQKNYAALVLIALRDYAHHFALRFHKKIAKVK